MPCACSRSCAAAHFLTIISFGVLTSPKPTNPAFIIFYSFRYVDLQPALHDDQLKSRYLYFGRKRATPADSRVTPASECHAREQMRRCANDRFMHAANAQGSRSDTPRRDRCHRANRCVMHAANAIMPADRCGHPPQYRRDMPPPMPRSVRGCTRGRSRRCSRKPPRPTGTARLRHRRVWRRRDMPCPYF